MYKIGDIIKPKQSRHAQWPERLIVGYDFVDSLGIMGYLWKYTKEDIQSGIYSSLNSSDPELIVYWQLKT